ncbi:hypothetical protein GQ44DRAFT_743160 [Phaeosphaeriaceae sp. PMI808]|nr:hypothetical protein GQ44DRAFT_743160 [Phaeosphaeriaceae sp. PMI808]
MCTLRLDHHFLAAFMSVQTPQQIHSAASPRHKIVIQLPYFGNPDQLPCSLPTLEDIKVGQVVQTNRENFISGNQGHVVSVRNCFIVKYGPYIRENEGYALLLLEKYPSIPAPRLYTMYREDSILYLIMQLLPGQNLRSVWEDLSGTQKVHICDQLREAFTQIRSIPSPGIFGDVIGGPLPHLFFGWRGGDLTLCGPFETLEDLHMGLALHSEKQQLLNNRRPWSSECTFTHCDLARQNILVQEQVGIEGQTERLFKLTAKTETFLDPWPPEAAMLRAIKVDIEGF